MCLQWCGFGFWNISHYGTVGGVGAMRFDVGIAYEVVLAVVGGHLNQKPLCIGVYVGKLCDDVGVWLLFLCTCAQ